jgi:transcriptional regulator with XRE-family HTH domain
MLQLEPSKKLSGGYMSFAKMLRKELKERGWSIYRLAELSGIPPSTIKGWLYNAREPGMVNAQKVAKALGMTVEALVAAADAVSETKASYDSKETPAQVLEDIASKVHRLKRMLGE